MFNNSCSTVIVLFVPLNYNSREWREQFATEKSMLYPDTSRNAVTITLSDSLSYIIIEHQYQIDPPRSLFEWPIRKQAREQYSLC